MGVARPDVNLENISGVDKMVTGSSSCGGRALSHFAARLLEIFKMEVPASFLPVVREADLFSVSDVAAASGL